MTNIIQKILGDSGGMYHAVYIKKDGEFVSLEDDCKDFCEKWIKPVHPKNWNWSQRNFDKKENDPTIEEARAIRDLLIKDFDSKQKTIVDLSSLENVEIIKAFFDPANSQEAYNMQEFAYALKVELEHGKIKDANVTNNHPFLTAMIVLAHMSESVTYYKRLKVMEIEAELFEMERSQKQNEGKDLDKKIAEKKAEWTLALEDLEHRLSTMADLPVIKKFEDE